MKVFNLLAAILLSHVSAYAQQAIVLNQAELDLGSLGLSQTETFLLVERIQATPQKVKLKYQHAELYSFCAEGEQVPYCEDVCEGPFMSDCTRYCSERWVCHRYGTGSRERNKTLTLDFKKAHALEAAQSEIFRLSLVQKNAYQIKVESGAEAVNTSGAYNIKRQKALGIFNVHGFKFEKQ